MDTGQEGNGMIENDVVDAVLNDLEDRSGFDWWWDDIDPDIREEIKAELAAKVRTVLDGGNTT
jgi:hypothetical protein